MLIQSILCVILTIRDFFCTCTLVSLYTSGVFFLFMLFVHFLCFCVPVLCHLVVKAASIDRYSCLSGSLLLLFLNACAIYCVCFEANKYSQSVRLSVCPSMGLRQQTRCCRFADVGPVGRRYRQLPLQRRASAGACTLLTKYGTTLYRNILRLETVFANCICLMCWECCEWLISLFFHLYFLVNILWLHYGE